MSGYGVRMSRASELLAAVTTEPVTTSDLYTRIGYATLGRIGLIPYSAFRAELAELAAAGYIESMTRLDGSTLWRRIDGAGPADRSPLT